MAVRSIQCWLLGSPENLKSKEQGDFVALKPENPNGIGKRWAHVEDTLSLEVS